MEEAACSPAAGGLVQDLQGWMLLQTGADHPCDELLPWQVCDQIITVVPGHCWAHGCTH